MFKLSSDGNLEWAKTFGTLANEFSYDLERLPSGGYAASGQSDGYGAGGSDFVLLTLSQDLEDCGNLIANDIALHVTDVTSHADLLFQAIALTDDLSYGATIPCNPVSPTVTDILPQLTSQSGKEICTTLA